MIFGGELIDALEMIDTTASRTLRARATTFFVSRLATDMPARWA